MESTTILPSFTEFKMDQPPELPNTLLVNVGDRDAARAIAHNQTNEIATWCRQLRKKDAWLAYGAGKYLNSKGAWVPYKAGKFRVLATAGMDSNEAREFAISGGRPELLNASQLDILQFLAEQDRLGKIVILTWDRRSRNPNRAFYTSDRLTTERGIYTPSQFHDFDYLESWRKADPSLKKFNKLCDNLDQHNFVSKFDYELVRPNGDLCSYQTDYYKLINRHGEEIRAGVSDPLAYSVLKYAEATS